MAKSITRRALKYWTVALFFLYWNQKRKIRGWLSRSSLVVLSASTVLLAVEVVAEYRGADDVVSAIKMFSQEYQAYLLTIFVLSVLFLILHHYEEGKRPEYEYAFVLRLWEFMESYRKGQRPLPRVRSVLEIFHGLYRNSGIAHVSIYRMGEDGMLRIDPAEVYPEEKKPEFYVDLKKGEGVAGRVFEDMKARYMPVLFLAGFFFPHAVNFEWQTQPIAGTPRPTFDLADLDFELDIFKPSASREFPFRSFLSVPLKSTKTNTCVGVLNFDFHSTNPLDKRDVAMAMVIGLILADEI